MMWFGGRFLSQKCPLSYLLRFQIVTLTNSLQDRSGESFPLCTAIPAFGIRRFLLLFLFSQPFAQIKKISNYLLLNEEMLIRPENLLHR